MNTLEKIKQGTASLCRDLLEDGVTYVEIRTGLKNMDASGYEEYVKAILEGVRIGTAGSHQLQVKWILSLKRNSSPGFIPASASL